MRLSNEELRKIQNELRQICRVYSPIVNYKNFTRKPNI